MIRRVLLPALLAALVVPPLAHGQAPAPSGDQTAAASPAGSGSSSCPSFQVLHDDRIGTLSLPAGAYQITIGTPSTLSCAQASVLFREFLLDFDGRLSGGWAVNATASSFSRAKPKQSFSVKRTGASPPSGGSSVQPIAASVCPAAFQVLHDDRVGDLAIPAGKYTLSLISTQRMTCDQAASSLAQFLQDYDGVLPKPWFVDPETATFLKGTVNAGFQLEPLVGKAPSSVTLKLPGDGEPCPGTFQVLHDDKVGKLSVPAGHYLFVPLAGSSLSCDQIVKLIRQFLAAPGNAVPSPWVLDAKTGTFRKGKGSKVAFRLKPASSS